VIIYDNFYTNTEERWKNNRFQAWPLYSSYLPHPEHQSENLLPHVVFAPQFITGSVLETRIENGELVLSSSPVLSVAFSIDKSTPSPVVVAVCEFTPWCIRPWFLLHFSGRAHLLTGDTLNIVFPKDIIRVDRTQMFLIAARKAISRGQGNSAPPGTSAGP
jgi:hypothetical protein